jgi:zinc protease
MRTLPDLHALSVAVLFFFASSTGIANEISATGPGSPPRFTHIRTIGGIEEYRLDENGLAVLLVPQRSSPVMTVQVVYHVGSRNEGAGTTGATHLLEHMMFKGSEAFNDERGNSVKQYLERVGAEYNAMTERDDTAYFATFDPDAFDGYLAAEADRMRNLRLRDSDRRAEMTVVRNELERAENNPETALFKAVYACAYQALPYHNPVLGWRSDIENIPIQRLRAFYDEYYWPNNAVIIVVGAFEPTSALAIIRKYYGVYPASPKPPPTMYTTEPEQNGQRRVIVRQPEQPGNVLVAYPIPAGLHHDIAALELLGEILSDGEDSPLYRALIDSRLATQASAAPAVLRDGGLFQVHIALAPGVVPERVEEVIFGTLTRLEAHGVTPADVQRAARRHRIREAYLRDGTSIIASQLAHFVSLGDWTQYLTHGAQIDRVTAEDIQRVAHVYLTVDRSTVGWSMSAIAP